MKKKCINCGKYFYKKEYDSKKYWEKKKFCSIKCCGENRTKELADKKDYDSYTMNATVDDIQNIANKFDEMGTESASQYAQVLRQMTNMDERSRAAMSFGLQQQPAFRKLMEKTQKKK